MSDRPPAETITVEQSLPPPVVAPTVAASAPGPCLTFGRLVGQSARMQKVIKHLKLVAPQNSTLLIEGDSGTGKELAAEAVHAASGVRGGPFVVLDCGAVPRTLLEAELFGHERGAFTGAVVAREGALARADGGTIFLDEIGELDLQMQPRLLRFLESRTVKPVGGSLVRRLTVRIIAATNRNLIGEVAKGRFRADLYYRLAVSQVRMPSLDERPEDIPLLCRHIIEDLSERDRTEYEVNPRLLAGLAHRRWPGNVRELRNVIERFALLGDDHPDEEASPSTIHSASSAARRFQTAKAAAIADFERHYLTTVMSDHHGNITAAATAASVNRVHFLRLLDRHGLRKSRAP